MERKNVEKYMRTADRDVKFIEEAICRGARPSLEEWHDFVFKSEISEFKSDMAAKYAVVHKKECQMARIGANILEGILTVQLSGFTDAYARRMVRGIVKSYNKLRRLSDRLVFYCEDKDGTVTFIVESYDMNSQVKHRIVNRDSLCYFLQDMWALMVRDLRIFNKDSRDFLVWHLDNEIKLIISGKSPAPYMGFMPANTLESVLYKRTDYENACKNPIVIPSEKPPITLKVANGATK